MSAGVVFSEVPQPAPPQAQRAGVLVIEDHDRQSVDLMTKLAGLNVQAMRARTGPEAVRMVATDRPSVIFVDGLLPGMHGFEVARFIRHIDRDYHPYIVMTTGIYKNVKYRNDAILKYGIDDYLVKPVPEAALVAILAASGFVVGEPLEVIAS